MTITELIAYADAVKPNAFDAATKIIWINEVEGMVQTDVMLIAADDIITHTDVDDELLIQTPHDKLYRTYLCAMIDFANGEYDKYNNAMTLFNRHYAEFSEWYTRIYRPANEEAEWQGYYISAYGIAVKHGYEGTEAEWLASLRGEQGEGFIISGIVATEEDLPEAEQGEAYAVGTAEANEIYIYDGEEWFNIGSLKGDKGDTGETGPQGIQGERGIQGVKGDAGLRGIQGEQGIQGIQGIPGEDGADGNNGADGYTPIKGVDYDDGADGNNGADGLSAYDAAVLGGYGSDETTFYADLAAIEGLAAELAEI